jgi:hypothetical protein
MGSIPAINFVNSLGNVKRVLYIGFRDGPPLFYANFPMVYNELNVYNRFIEEKDLGRLLDLLKEYNISHLIVEQKYGVEKLVSSPESEFANRHLRLIWNRNAVSVFEVHQNPLQQKEHQISNYLIDHIMQGTLLSKAGQPVYHANNYRDVHRLHPEPRFCILTFDQFEVRIPARIPEDASLRFGLGFKQNATRYPYVAEIFIHDSMSQQRKLFGRSLKLTERFEDQRWFEEEIDLSPFSGQQVEVIFTCRAEGAVEHQAYPLAVPDGIVLWSEPQIIRRRSRDLDLIENFDQFKILPAARNPEPPDKAHVFVASLSEANPDSSKGLAIVSGGEARYDVLITQRSRLSFRLRWPECQEPGSMAEILLERDGMVKILYQNSLSACPAQGQPPQADVETVELGQFSGVRGTLNFRLSLASGKNGRQQVVFQNLKLQR